jgi:hypothetical protein
MRDLDTAFTELRNDIAGKTIGAPVPELTAKARRRTRQKIAAVAVAALVAVGGFLLPQSNGKQGEKPVISDTISPQPSSDRLVLKPTRLTLDDLLYGREVENNGWMHTDESHEPTVIPYVPSCDQPAPASRMTWFSSVEDVDRKGEQLVQFDSPYAAQQWLIKMTANRSCAVEFHRLAGADDSFSAEAKAENRTAVVVRQRSTVAIYWNRESNAAAFAQAQADALTMAKRLCDRGYCTEPAVTVKIPPATTLIHEKEWFGKSDIELVDMAKLGTDIGRPYVLSFLKDPGGGAYRIEELLVAISPEAAKQALATLVENNRTAKAKTRTEPRDIGDEAWYLRAYFTRGDYDDEQFEQIIVRQGNAIAIYAQKSEVVPVSQLESEARTMTERLKALGY